MKKNDIYVQLNHFAIHLKLAQHCESIILQFLKNLHIGKKERDKAEAVDKGHVKKWLVAHCKKLIFFYSQ